MDFDITIITVCRNSEATIKDTINSILPLMKNKISIEYIIQEGLSKDNTYDIATQMTKNNLGVKIFREKDYGIYDAMNKALEKAKGEYILFINSDDILLKNFLNKKIRKALKEKSFDFIASPIIYFKRPSFKIKRIFLISENSKNFFTSLIFSPYPPHPGFICRRSILMKHKFNLRYFLSADYLLMQQIIRQKKLRRLFTNKPLVAMAIGGKTGTKDGILNGMKQIKEINQILKIKEFLFVRYIRNILQLFLPIFINYKIDIENK